MDKNNVPDYIERIAKASAYFTFRNGPIKDIYEQGKLTDEELEKVQKYMQNHLAYLYKILLEESNIKKFDLIVQTMNNFYVNDKSEISYEDDGFENFYNQLFPKVDSSLGIKK
ncbi:MAG: hypothetical protein ACRDD2_06060 [Sarcina sp.]